MTDLAEHWTTTVIRDVADVFLGKTPARNDYTSNSKYKVVKFRDLKDGCVDFENAKQGFVRTDASLLRTLKELRCGDVLITSAAHSGENIGKKCAYVSEIPSKFERVYFTGELLNVRCKDQTIGKWAYFFFRSRDGFEEIQKAVTGVHLTGGRAQHMSLPIAPLAEQRRIVAKLEKLLRRVDACQQRLVKIPVLLKRFRQSVLAAACSGRLTADWREESPKTGNADELIWQVSQRRREKLEKLRATPAKDRRVALSDFDNIEPALRSDLDLPDVPDSWAWVDLRFVMAPEEPFCYGVVQPGEDDPQGPRLIRVCDIENGQVLKESLRGIPSSVHAQYQRSVLRGGEVLVSVVGTIGRPAIAPLDLAGVNIARAIAKIPVREFEARFVFLWLSTSRAENWMVGDAREVARKTLNLEQLRTLPIPLPPLSEQKEIVHRVESLFALADQIEARYAKANAYIETLTPSLLARAFRGELVPQDPNDEPASVLLE